MNRPALILLSIIISIQLTLFLYTSLRPNWIAPPGHTYTLLGGNFFYPNIIRQAKEGAWAIIDSHTTRPTPSVYGYVFFIAAGKVARVFHIDPILMYQITIVTGGIAFSIATYFLITLLLPIPLHVISLLFVLVLETAPRIRDIVSLPLPQWSATIEGQSAIARVFGLPHHVWGETLGLLLFSLIIISVKNMTLTSVVLIFILGFVGTNTLPSYFVILLSCVFIPWGLFSIYSKHWKQVIPPLIIAGLAILTGGMFVHFEFAKGAPWNAAVAVEKSWWTNEFVLIPFFQSLLLYYPFAFLGAILAPTFWKSMPLTLKRTFILALSWTVLPVFLILMSSLAWFPIANGRIASDISTFPMGVLAAIGVWALQKAIKRPVVRQYVLAISLGVLFGISTMLTIIYTTRVIESQDAKAASYPTTDTWRAMLSLQSIPQGSGVLVLPGYGEIIPGFSNTRVFIGGPHGFMDWIERRALAQQFYAGTMDPNAVKEFLITNDISYVFYGPDERAITTQSPLYPDLLTPVFQTNDTTVYKVK